MSVGGRAGARAWLAASLAGLGVLLAALLGVATNLATSLVPEDWSWARNPALTWGAAGVLVTLMLAVAVAATRLTDGGADRGTTAAQRVEQQVAAAPGGGDHPASGEPPAGEVDPPSAAVASNLPPRNPHFTGRTALLDEVAQSLRDGPVAVTAVQGIGGIGKTQLALESAYRGRDRGDYELTWWIRAESPLTLTEDLAGLAPMVGVPVGREQERTIAGVLAALRGRDRWLLVFDNAPDGDEIRRWLPGGSGHVLITSRERAWTGLARSVRVEEFSRTESVDYLGKHDPAGGVPAGELGRVLDELAAALGDLPLALAQAAAYLTRHGLSVAGYLRLYQDRAAAARLLAAGLPGYPHSVATTWLIHFEELVERQPAALELLRCCAFLDPDEINLELLLSRPDLLAGRLTGRLAEAAKDPAARLEIVGELAATGLVTRLDDLRVRMHRLVGQVTRQQLSADGQEAERSWAEHLIRLVKRLYPDEPWLPECWPACADLASHTVTLADHGAPAGLTGMALHSLGVYLDGRGEFAEAATILQRAIAAKEAAYGADHAEVAVSLNSLGIVQRQLAQFDAAHATLERALAVARAAHGRRHPILLRYLASLGTLEQERGRPHQARAVYRRALAIVEAAGDADQRDVAVVLGSLGNTLWSLGDLEGARTSYERAITMFTAGYGPDHPEIAAVLTNLGAVLADLGDFDEAARMLTRALTLKEAAYGPDHPEVAYVLANLGAVQLGLSESNAAHATLRRALKIRESTYGPDHPEVASVLANLGSLQEKMGETDVARHTWQRSLTILEAAYGSAHPQTRRVRELLGHDPAASPSPAVDSG